MITNCILLKSDSKGPLLADGMIGCSCTKLRFLSAYYPAYTAHRVYYRALGWEIGRNSRQPPHLLWEPIQAESALILSVVLLSQLLSKMVPTRGTGNASLSPTPSPEQSVCSSSPPHCFRWSGWHTRHPSGWSWKRYWTTLWPYWHLATSS